MGFSYEQYELAASRDNVDYNSWSNANGYNKADLISKIKNAKDTVIDRTGKLNIAQASYDEANSRNCSGSNKHPLCWKKDSDKANRANDISVYKAEINTANSNIGLWQNELDIILEEEANAPTTTNATTTGTNTRTGTGVATTTVDDTTKKSNTKDYLIIGGAVLILGIVGFFVFRKK